MYTDYIALDVYVANHTMTLQHVAIHGQEQLDQ
jgi:hypothetical protein